MESWPEKFDLGEHVRTCWYKSISIQLICCFTAVFLLSESGEAACSKPALPGGAVNILSYGATPDDGTDDTAAMQNAIDATPVNGTLYIPAGTFKVNPTYLAGVHGLSLHSNMTVWMDTNAVVEAIPVSSSQYTIFSLLHINDVTITGGTIKGERAGHTGSTGEYGYGIAVYSSQNIKIQNLTVRDAWGDGIYVTEYRDAGDDPREPNKLTKNITICSVIADNNRRQGLSVTAADYVAVENSRFINSNGATVSSGIDLEPNPDPGSTYPYTYTWYTVTNVIVRDCEMTNNESHGINVYRANNSNTIEHNIIQRNLRNGVRVFESNGTTILRNWIEDNGKAATWHGHFADVELVGTTNTLVKLNSLRDGTPYNQVGVWLQGVSTGNSIIDNDICMNTYTILDQSTDHAFTESLNTVCERDPYSGKSFVPGDSGRNDLHFLSLLLAK